MKRTLLLFSLLAIAGFSKAQIEIYYQDALQAENDTIIVNEKSPNDDVTLYIGFKNTASRSINAHVTATHISGSNQIKVIGMCAGGCSETMTTPLFTIEGESMYNGFDALLEIDPNLPKGTSTLFQFTVQDTLNLSNNASVYVKYVIDSTLGISNSIAKKDIAVNIYPNPTKGKTTIAYSLPENAVANSQIVVRNMLGTIVMEVPIHEVKGSKNIDFSSYPNGVYFYSITNNGKVYQTKKLIVKK